MKYRLFGVILALASPVATANPETADADLSEQRAIKLIDEMQELYRGESSIATLTMSIETPQYSRTLRMEAKSIGIENSFIRILDPRKDRGIATLKLDKEMWNYFPKISKVIKVPPSMMMGSWMGSDFTNDDLVQQTTLTETYKLGLEETEDEYRVTLRPREQTITVWGRIDYVIDKDNLIPRAEIFYDDDDTMIRRLEFKQPKEFDGVLIPSVLEMTPLNKEGHKTVITYESLAFDTEDVSPDDFTLRNLQSRF
jgi:hypothetical protein